MIPKLSLWSAVFLGFAAVASPLHAEGGWTDLFNGKDLDNWEQRGGKAQYAVEDGVIVGTTVANTGNSFLCTKRSYANFILELDFKVNPDLNSGVQFRSECFDHETTPAVKDEHGKDIKIPANRVHGYQCEIDMDPKHARWWTAGLYEEGRRGWLFPGMRGGDGKEFTAQGKTVSKQNEWNHLRIEAVGSSIKTFLNGEARVTATDDLTPTGFIGLQVHSVGTDDSKAGLKAFFKNVRIQDLGETPAGEAKTATPGTVPAQNNTSSVPPAH